MEELNFLRHFECESFSLTQGDMGGVILFTAAFHIICFGICRTCVFNRKKLAFCLTAINALLMCILSLIYINVKRSIGHDIFDYYGADVKWWACRDNFSVIVSIMFGTANVMDLSLGWLYYREHLSVLTTWLHHSVYIWLMILVVTGNGFVTSVPDPIAPAFMCALIEEIPTALLALGTIFPQYRQDLAFGISFGLTRIVFHTYLLVYMLRFDLPFIVTICYVNPLLLHGHWFSGWLAKYSFDKEVKAKVKSS